MGLAPVFGVVGTILPSFRPPSSVRRQEEYRGGTCKNTGLHLRPPSAKAAGAAGVVAARSLFKRSPIGALFAARSQFLLEVSPSEVIRAAGEAARTLASEAIVVAGAVFPSAA